MPVEYRLWYHQGWIISIKKTEKKPAAEYSFDHQRQAWSQQLLDFAQSGELLTR
jgi:hypothetical protein